MKFERNSKNLYQLRIHKNFFQVQSSKFSKFEIEEPKISKIMFLIILSSINLNKKIKINFIKLLINQLIIYKKMNLNKIDFSIFEGENNFNIIDLFKNNERILFNLKLRKPQITSHL